MLFKWEGFYCVITLNLMSLHVEVQLRGEIERQDFAILYTLLAKLGSSETK